MNLSAKKGIEQKTLLVFGASLSFNDSTIYLTDIHSVDSIWINTRNNYLLNRDNYSYELRNYLDKQGLKRRACAIFYSEKRKDIEKLYERVKDKSIKRGNIYIEYIPEDDFRFEPIALEDYEIEALKAKDAQEQKEKKEKKRGGKGNFPDGERPSGPPPGGGGGGRPPM